MLRVVQLPPPITASTTPCPQCGATMHIRLVAPDTKMTAERHQFECTECGLPRTYIFERSGTVRF